MKNLITLLAILLSINFSIAQDQAIFKQYHVNPVLIFPAATGFTGDHHIFMNIRSQWTGFPGAPKTYAVNYNGPLGKTFGIGVGLFSENIASISRLKFQINYAFRFELKKFKLGAGFSTEFHRYKIGNSIYNSSIYDSNDNILDDYVNGTKTFDASLGVWAAFNNNTFAGLSFPNLVLAKIGDIESGEPQGQFFKYYIAFVGHHFDFEEFHFSLEPSFLVHKIIDVPFMADFNVKAGFLDEKLIAGLSYRAGIGGALGILLGTKLPPFRVYYSYDVSFQKFQKYNSGTHELTFAFDFEKGKSKYDRSKKYRN